MLTHLPWGPKQWTRTVD